MSKVMVRFFVVLCCWTLLASGCAKKELVKGEGEVTPAPTAIPAETSAKPPIKEEVVREQAVKEAPTAIREEAALSDSAAQLQAALEKIYFDFDSFVLSGQSRDSLSRDAKLLLKNGSAKVQIEGHCDERGSDEYNLALGEKRAKAAMNYLVTLGVPSSQLSFISYGKEKPADSGHDEAAWAKNRRDEFVVIK
ncbi:MAG: peptidoglycan-associated lipoprotein Pal [Geobacteraceae bacterium]|jgi:peptidoglycan-associated lipoprotein